MEPSFRVMCTTDQTFTLWAQKCHFSLGGSNETLPQCWIAFIHSDPALIPPKTIPRRSKASLYTLHYLDFQVL